MEEIGGIAIPQRLAINAKASGEIEKCTTSGLIYLHGFQTHGGLLKLENRGNKKQTVIMRPGPGIIVTPSRAVLPPLASVSLCVLISLRLTQSSFEILFLVTLCSLFCFLLYFWLFVFSSSVFHFDL